MVEKRSAVSCNRNLANLSNDLCAAYQEHRLSNVTSQYALKLGLSKLRQKAKAYLYKEPQMVNKLQRLPPDQALCNGAILDFMARKARRQFNKASDLEHWQSQEGDKQTTGGEGGGRKRKDWQVIGTHGNITALHTFKSTASSRPTRTKKKKRHLKRIRALGPVDRDIHFAQKLQPMPESTCIHVSFKKNS